MRRDRFAYRRRSWRSRLGWFLRHTLADRIDHANAPRLMHVSFTFEPYCGIVWHEDGRGCPVAYLSQEQYEWAHDDALVKSPSLADLLGNRGDL